jgi:uncharacterized membrane protein (UPF0127 family)
VAGIAEIVTEAGAVVCTRCVLAERLGERMRGLLGRQSIAAGEGMLITPASSVHTAFMRFPIDVVFLDRSLVVKKVVPELGPWRVAGALGARSTLELPAGAAAEHGLSRGVRLRLRT